MNKRNYAKIGFLYLIGNIFNKGISFITVPIFTRILAASDYGIINTYYSWVDLLTIVIGLAIYMGVRASFIDYKKETKDFLCVCTSFTYVCGAIFLFFTVISFMFVKSMDYRIILILCILHGCACAIIQNYSVYLMMTYRYIIRIVYMVLPGLVSIVISVFVIKKIKPFPLFLGRIIPTAAIYFAFALIASFLIYRDGNAIWNTIYLRYALRISIPLVVHGAALIILAQSDRTMITLLSNSSNTGIYSLIYNYSTAAVVITSALDGIWIPWFTERLNLQRIDEINEWGKKYVQLIAIAIIGLILFGPEIIHILAPEKYWEGIYIIPPIVVSNFVVYLYTLYVNVEHYHKKTVQITVNTLAAAGLNILLNGIFIPIVGYFAAAYTTFISYIVLLVLHSKFSKKLEPKLYPLKNLMPYLLLVIVSVFLFYMFIDYWAIRWCGYLVCVALFLYRQKDSIYTVIRERCNGKKCR